MLPSRDTNQQDGLIRMKKKLGREKDLMDIALIEKVRETNQF